MRERGRRVLLGVMLLVSVVPLLFLLMCPQRASCLRSMWPPSLWLAGAAKVGLALSAASLVAWAARLAWLLRVDARLVHALHASRTPPAKLQAALSGVGLRRARCVVSERPIAFCAGALRPVVVVSDGLARCLPPAELRAVLIHELDHATRREPLLRAATRSAADVLFYAPAVRWWCRWLAAKSELRADRAAIDAVGRSAVARALITLAGDARLYGAAAFAGIARLRVAQVLGEPLPPQTPELSVLGITGAGFYLAFVVTACLVNVALRLVH